MRTLSVLAFVCAVTLAVANPTKKIEKKSISNALAPRAITDQQAEEAKLNEETLLESPGENVDRAKKATTTFCVEIQNDHPVQVNCADLCPPSAVVQPVVHPVIEQPIIHQPVQPVVPCQPEIGAYLVQQPAEVVYAPTGNCITHGGHHGSHVIQSNPTVVNVPGAWPAHQQHVPLHPAGVECTCKSTPGGVVIPGGAVVPDGAVKVLQDVPALPRPMESAISTPDDAARRFLDDLHKKADAHIKSIALKKAALKMKAANPPAIKPMIELKESSPPAPPPPPPQPAPAMMQSNAPTLVPMAMPMAPSQMAHPQMMVQGQYMQPQMMVHDGQQAGGARTVQIFPGSSPLVLNPTSLSSMSVPALPSLPSLPSGLLHGFDSRAAMMGPGMLDARYIQTMPSLDPTKQALYEQYHRQQQLVALNSQAHQMMPMQGPVPIGGATPFMMKSQGDCLDDSFQTGMPVVQGIRIGRGQDEKDAKAQEEEQKEKDDATTKSEKPEGALSDVLDHMIKNNDSKEETKRVARFFPNEQNDAEVTNLLEDN